MSEAFKCDHCDKYLNGSGSHWVKREVCRVNAGVRYRTVMFVYGASGPPVKFQARGKERADYESSGQELCGDCINVILLASLNREKL